MAISPNTSVATPKPLPKRLPLSPALVNSRCKTVVTSVTRTPPCSNFPVKSTSEPPTALPFCITSSDKTLKDLPSISVTALSAPVPGVVPVPVAVLGALLPVPLPVPLPKLPPALLHALRAS